jgi:hypothetical protein
VPNKILFLNKGGKSKKLEKDGNRFRLLFIETPKFKTAYFMAFLDDDNDDNIVKKSNFLKKDKKYNGLVLYFNLNGVFVIGEKIINGKRTAYALKTKTTSGTKKQESSKATETESLNCTTEIIEYWYQDCYYILQGDLIRCDAQVVYDVEIITYCEGNPDDGGGGGNGGGGSSNCGVGGSAGPLTVDVADPDDPNNPIPPPCDEEDPFAEIINNITDPCLKSMVQNAIDNDIRFNIEQSLNSIFNKNDDFNLVFDQSTSLPTSVDGATTIVQQGGTVGFPLSGRSLTVSISLNSNTLPNSSKEYITATILHEALHAYFEFRQTILDHTNMADNYLNWFKVSLLNIYPNMPLVDVEALAWGGLQSTWKWNNTLTDISQQNILNINHEYKDGNKWTKCN